MIHAMYHFWGFTENPTKIQKFHTKIHNETGSLVDFAKYNIKLNLRMHFHTEPRLWTTISVVLRQT